MASTVKETLDAILNFFESGGMPEAMDYSVFPGRDIPSAKWSLLNRIATFLSGTADARGFRQWKQVNRLVKKGAKAIHILVPRMVKRSAQNEQGEQEEQVVPGRGSWAGRFSESRIRMDSPLSMNGSSCPNSRSWKKPRSGGFQSRLSSALSWPNVRVNLPLTRSSGRLVG